MASSRPLAHDSNLARQARERFVAELCPVVPTIAQTIEERLFALADEAGNARDTQIRRDSLLMFQKNRAGWAEAVPKAWRTALTPPTATGRIRLEKMSFELMGDDVVENKILSSRLALSLLDKVNWELNDLRLRIQTIEGLQEFNSYDIFRPEVIAQNMVERWLASNLSRPIWNVVQDVIQGQLADKLLECYHNANEFLIQNGVMEDIDLKPLVRRTPSAVSSDNGGGGGGSGGGGGGGGNGNYRSRDSRDSRDGRDNRDYRDNRSSRDDRDRDRNSNSDYSSGSSSGYSDSDSGRSTGSGSLGSSSTPLESTRARSDRYSPSGSTSSGNSSSGSNPSSARGQAPSRSSGDRNERSDRSDRNNRPASSDRGQQYSRDEVHTGGGSPGNYQSSPAEETRMQTAGTPLARAKQRAQGLVGQLRRMLSDRVPEFEQTQAVGLTPKLAQAMNRAIETMYADSELDAVPMNAAGVEQAARRLRQRAGELKTQSSSSTEKATIEVVALMFQSILAEERIPAAVRVWFARLQMPVLRVAISDPEFFGTLTHPARQLIDRMGSCVMGFNAAAINGSALEIEIKRVVQVIEQYPETGQRVFQLVFDEFQLFLSKFLTEKSSTQRLVSVAQQVEQKETLAVQYTIELRKLLNDMPVREEIREFLFKVWAEVLAVAAIKNGPKHDETASLKRAAADLVWAASAKPNRNDRTRVIQDLPQLLQRLRQGMTLLGVTGEPQEEHIKIIGDTLADAFMSKTEAIPQAKIETMARRLADLEDFVTDEEAAELNLDSQSIELMLGIDSSTLEVVADGGSQPTEAMIAWAEELQLGNWFMLDHNNSVTQVQFVWRSDRKQLHLFATPEGFSYLIQARRLAAYLQAGLLVPAEDETLTVRATREALAKLNANPERLLG